jgi:hypothetical protein
MRRSRFLIPLALLAAAPFLLAACGGDDDGGGSEDEDQITEVIETSVSSDDPADCTELSTQAFVEQTTFETGEAAVAQCEEDAADPTDDADSVEVSDISVDGEAATANVAFTGGTFDGSTVTVSLLKEGDQWKLDSIDDIPEFDRAAFDAAFIEQIEAEEDIPAQVSTCITDAFSAASDDQIKEAFLSGDGERLNALFTECIPS